MRKKCQSQCTWPRSSCCTVLNLLFSGYLFDDAHNLFVELPQRNWERKRSSNEGPWMVVDARWFSPLGLRVVRLLQHLGSSSRRFLQDWEFVAYLSHLHLSFFCEIMSFSFFFLAFQVSKSLYVLFWFRRSHYRLWSRKWNIWDCLSWWGLLMSTICSYWILWCCHCSC